MEKIKRFIDCYISTKTCNLKCHYCYISLLDNFENEILTLTHSPAFIRKALSQQRLGGVCLFNLCAGGETLLSKDVLPVVKELLSEGHYVMIVTNGTLKKRFEEISRWPSELLKRLMIKFSFHYLELKRLNLMEIFWGNVLLMKQINVSFSVEVTPSDELVPYIKEVKSICLEKVGALCHVTIARDDRKKDIDILSKMNFEEYVRTWSAFDSDLFKFKSEVFQVKRNEYCYAGNWSIYLDLNSGNIKQCYCGKIIGNIYDLEKNIDYTEIRFNCELPYCYNGHAFLTIGTIPDLKTPTYAQMRNRVCADGSEWLTTDVKNFFSSKLCESNKKHSNFYKMKLVAKDRLKKERTKLSVLKYKMLNGK